MDGLVKRMVQGDARAVARGMTLLENEAPEAGELRQALANYRGLAHVVGITGSPGVGKSSLVDGLIHVLRQQGKRVGVLAVDPSSPFTGGALLGDRVRMGQHSADPDVYIRSVGARGSVGGLASSVSDLLLPLQASGCSVILLETVGAGQSEIDVMMVADTILVVLAPGIGDAVQTAKAGILEIADILVVNKQDMPGAAAFAQDVAWMMSARPERAPGHETGAAHGMRHGAGAGWTPEVMLTDALQSHGVPELWQAVERHQRDAILRGRWEERRKQRWLSEVIRLAGRAYMSRLQQLLQASDNGSQQPDCDADPHQMAAQWFAETTRFPDAR